MPSSDIKNWRRAPEGGGVEGVDDWVHARVGVGQHVGPDLDGDVEHGEGVQAQGLQEQDHLRQRMTKFYISRRKNDQVPYFSTNSI